MRKNERLSRQKRFEASLKSREEGNGEYSYMDFGLEPIDTFVYGSYTHVWCKYCGSRFGDGFGDGPWGPKTLCMHHSKLWKKGKL